MIKAIYDSNTSSIRAVATGASAYRYNYTLGAWEAHDDDNWSDYLASPTQLGTSKDYTFDVPSDTKSVAVYSGTSPVVTDSPIGTATIGTSVLPVSQVPVSEGRIAVLQQTSDGLVGEVSKTLQVGEDKLMGADFRNDMPTNGRFAAIVSVELQSGLAGGITFDVNEQGVDKTLLKFKVAAVTAGTYVVRCKVAYSPNNEAAEGDVTIVVVD